MNNKTLTYNEISFESAIQLFNSQIGNTQSRSPKYDVIINKTDKTDKTDKTISIHEAGCKQVIAEIKIFKKTTNPNNQTPLATLQPAWATHTIRKITNPLIKKFAKITTDGVLLGGFEMGTNDFSTEYLKTHWEIDSALNRELTDTNNQNPKHHIQ